MRKNPESIWLKKRISGLAYGEKTEKGVRPSISKKSLIKNNFINRLSNLKINEHSQDIRTLYYYGNGKTTSEETLVMIDIDVQKKHKKGSTKGAYDFLNHIKKYFPNLYFETSTNNNGLHSYFILKKYNKSAKETNEALKGFEYWLKNESEKIKADIEDVEIKGLCPEVIYNNNKISNIKYGTLAKIPRNLQKISSIDNQCLTIEEIKNNYFIKNKTKKKENTGSVSNKLFSKKDLKKIKLYKRVFRCLTNNHKLKAKNHIVKDEDFAIALLILLFIYKNPNTDNTIPTERVKQLWKSLYEFNNIKRNWNHHRFKAIRDFLSYNNYINWEDNRYTFGNKITNQKGIACKWKLSETFILYIKNVLHRNKTEKKTSLVDSNDILINNIKDKIRNNIIIKENNTNLRPVLRAFRLIDYENILSKFYLNMENLCSV